MTRGHFVFEDLPGTPWRVEQCSCAAIKANALHSRLVQSIVFKIRRVLMVGLFSLTAMFVFAQKTPSPETPLPQEASVPGTTGSPESAPPQQVVPLPVGTELVDLEYVEPDPDLDETAFTRPPENKNSSQRIGMRLYEYLFGPADTRRREPLRRFDWNLFAMNVSAANNLIGAPDIFQETIRISGTELFARAEGVGVKLNTDILFRSALDFNRDDAGFGFFVTMDGRVDLDVSETLLSLFAQGNAGKPSMSGSLSVSGAIFSDIGIHRYFDVGKWRVDIRPAWFIPLVYVPKTDVSLIFESDDTITVGASGSMTAYLPVNLDKSGIGMLNNAGGLDFSAAVEYALFPIVDVGLTITHIPFMPARLSNKVRASIDGNILDKVSVIDILKDPDSLSINFTPDYTSSSAEIYVTRPFSMNTWLLYRPFRIDLLSIKPNIGFTANTPAGQIYFNAGLELQLNVKRVLFLSLRSGREDGVWQNGAGLGINLHIIQLNFEAALASQEYLSAWKGRGLSVGIGLHAGY
jgi:hypothetical protein